MDGFVLIRDARNFARSLPNQMFFCEEYFFFSKLRIFLPNISFIGSLLTNNMANLNSYEFDEFSSTNLRLVTDH